MKGMASNAKSITAQQLLDHLAESGIYTEADLQPFSKRLGELRAIVRRDADNAKHPMQLTKLMTRKLEGCGESASPALLCSFI